MLLCADFLDSNKGLCYQSAYEINPDNSPVGDLFLHALASPGSGRGLGDSQF